MPTHTNELIFVRGRVLNPFCSRDREEEGATSLAHHSKNVHLRGESGVRSLCSSYSILPQR